MKKFLTVLFVLLLSSFVFANGVSLNSPGTRAISMGGAYVAHVNDYSAPYWNPAGLMNVHGTQASFFLTELFPMATYENEIEGIDAKTKMKPITIPNAAFLWKCMVYKKLHLGLSFIIPAGLAVEWDGDDLKSLSGGESFTWESRITVVNFSLSAAMRFYKRLNVGIAFHGIYGDMTLKKGLPNPLGGGAQFSEESDGWGFGIGAGAQYDLYDNVKLGASIRTRMPVTFKGEAENPLMPIYYEYMGITDGVPTTSDFEREIAWPLWIGCGVAVRPIDKLLLCVEAQWSQWSETQDVLTAEYDDPYWDSFMTSQDKDKMYLKWMDRTQMRFGAEYSLNKKWDLRCGYYLDPAPGPDKTLTTTIPNTDFSVLTGGFGYCMGRLNFDFAMEYLLGQNRYVEESDTYDNMPGKHGLNIFVSSIAVTYKFGCKSCKSCKGCQGK